MAVPITWRTMQAPTFAASNRLAIEAGQQIQDSIAGLGNVFTQRDDRISGENTERGMQQIAGLQGVENYHQRLNDVLGGFDAGSSDLTALTNFGREQYSNVKADQQFGRNEKDYADAGILNNALQGMLNNPDKQYTQREIQENLMQLSAGMNPTIVDGVISRAATPYAPTHAEAAGIKAADDRREIQIKLLDSQLKREEDIAAEQAKTKFAKPITTKSGSLLNAFYDEPQFAGLREDPTDANLYRLNAVMAKFNTDNNQNTIPIDDGQGGIAEVVITNDQFLNMLTQQLAKDAKGRWSFKDVPIDTGNLSAAISEYVRQMPRKTKPIPKDAKTSSGNSAKQQILKSLGM